jgi:spectinomycin phosphotransferase
VGDQAFNNPAADQLKTFLFAKRIEILDLLQYTDRLAAAIQAKTAEFVPCHADIHAANLLVDENGGLHILDWDDLILAPKERDLMYIGAGICGVWDNAAESALFYQGYGFDPDLTLIAYYRCDRIIEDIALFSQHILKGSGSLNDRELSLRYLQSNFEPGGTINLALKTTYAHHY